MINKEALIERIKALLARSAQGMNETEASFESRHGEVANCVKMAHKLMREHNIEQFDLEGEDGFKERGITHKTIPIGKYKAFGIDWAIDLAGTLGLITYCKPLHTRNEVTFVGEEFAVEVACLLYEHLTKQMFDLCKKVIRTKDLVGGTWTYKKYVREFLLGMSLKIHNRAINEFRLKAANENSMIRVTAELNNTYADDKFDIEPAKEKEVVDPLTEKSEALLVGYMLGDRVDFETKVLTGNENQETYTNSNVNDQETSTSR